MNQKEILEKQLVSYYLNKGAFIFSLALVYLFSIIMFLIPEFSLLPFFFSALALFFLMKSYGKNLKWEAKYKPNEKD